MILSLPFSLILTNTCMLAKKRCFTDGWTCPTNDPNLPTFSHWQNSRFTGRFNSSHKWPKFANIFTLAKQPICRTFSFTPNFSQLGQYFHNWYFTPCSSLWRFHQIHSSKPESTFTPKLIICNNLCYTTYVDVGKFADLPDVWKRPTNDPN